MHSGYDVKKKKRDEEKDQNAAGVKVDAALADDEGKNSSGNAQGTGDGRNIAAMNGMADAVQVDEGKMNNNVVYQSELDMVPDPVQVTSKISVDGAGETQEIEQAGGEEAEVNTEAGKEVVTSMEKTQQPGSVNLVHDIEKAITIAKMGEGHLLDQETQDKVNEILSKSKAARAIFGMDAEDTMRLYQIAEESGKPEDLIKANVARGNYLRGDVTPVIGVTLGTYYETMQNENFPDEYRDEMTSAILQVALEAEEAYERGEFTYDPEKENLFEVYCRLNPEALRIVKGVNRVVHLMRTEERNQKLLDAETERMAKEQKLNDAIVAVKNRNPTVDQLNLVADSMPVINRDTAITDPAYQEKYALLYKDKHDSFATPGSWYNEKTIDYLLSKGLEPDLGSAAAVAYEEELWSFVESELLKDERISIGMYNGDLNAYYDSQGGFSIENIYMRASAAMQQYGGGISGEEAEAMNKLAYQGTGENVSTGEIVANSIKHGASYAAAEALDGFWMLGQVTNEMRSDLIAQSKQDAIEKYTPVLARWGRKKEWYDYLDTGMYPSEEYRAYVERVLDSNIDVFLLGPVPDTKNPILQGAVKADETTEKTGKWAQETLNENQGQLFEAGSGMTSNSILQAMSVLLNTVTRSELLSAGLTVGMMDVYPKEMRKQLLYAKNLNEANAVAGLKASGAVANETILDIGLTGKVLDATGISGAIQNGKQAANRVDTARGMSGMWKVFSYAFAESTIETVGDDLIVLETQGRWIDQFIDGAAQAKKSGADFLEIVAAGLENIEITGTIDEVLRDVPEGLVYSLPVIFTSGLSDGWKETKRAAQELMMTGNPEAAREFVGALNEEIKDPKNKAELNQYLSDVKTGQMAAGIVMTDGETRTALKEAQNVQEEANHFRTEAEKSTEAMEAAAQQYEAKIEEVIAGVPGSGAEANAIYDEYTGHQSDAQKYGAEYEKKAAQANDMMSSAVNGAINKATVEVNQQTQKQWEVIIGERQSLGTEKDGSHAPEQPNSDAEAVEVLTENEGKTGDLESMNSNTTGDLDGEAKMTNGIIESDNKGEQSIENQPKEWQEMAIASPRFVNKLDLLYQNSENIETIEGYEDVVLHGDKYGFVFRDADDHESNVSVKEFAEILKTTPSYHGGPIRLVSCETGADGSITAQALADEMGVEVLAPSDIVFILPTGKMIIGPNPLTNSGKWNIFKPRK